MKVNSSAQRTVIVTGGNAGLGYQTAKRLAADGNLHVIIACRDADRGNQAAARIAAQTGNDAVESMPLDLARQGSIRRFVEVLGAQSRPPLGALVCNAGTQIVRGLVLTED